MQNTIDTNTHVEEGAATASLELVWLILRTCSLTLDFASTIDPVEVPEAAVDRARERTIALLAFGAPWMRILAADDSDMALMSLRATRRIPRAVRGGKKERDSRARPLNYFAVGAHSSQACRYVGNTRSTLATNLVTLIIHAKSYDGTIVCQNIQIDTLGTYRASSNAILQNKHTEIEIDGE